MDLQQQIAMRRQAQDELAIAIGAYTSQKGATSTKLYECSRQVAVYVAHGLLSEREVRERFFDAARATDEIEKYGVPWAAKAIRSALNAANSDPLPPLRGEYCAEVEDA